jgi:hypothetical protein
MKNEENNYYRKRIKKILEEFIEFYNDLNCYQQNKLTDKEPYFYKNLYCITAIYIEGISSDKIFKENENFYVFILNLYYKEREKSYKELNCNYMWGGGFKRYDLIDKLLYDELNRQVRKMYDVLDSIIIPNTFFKLPI